MLDRIEDHVGDAIERLPRQHRQEKIEALLAALVRPAQELEEAFYDLIHRRTIDEAEGQSLDEIGKIVVQPRGGASDETYRRRLKGKVAANKSHGVPRNLKRIVEFVAGDG